jgi:hypothetical protein
MLALHAGPSASTAVQGALPRVLNCRPSQDMHKDWRFDHAVGARLVSLPAELPASHDLRASWWTIGNQGSTGSCVGWATTDSVLRWHFVKAGRLTTRQRLSPRFTWMAAKETDESHERPTTFIEGDGTSLKAALDVSRKYGAVLDSILPFSRGHLFPGEAETFYATASRLKISSYFNLANGADRTRDWQVWLFTQGPILTRLNVDVTWYNARATKGKLDKYRPDTARGGHAVALVGYTPSYFIVRNSWGPAEWGDGGFAYASLAYADAAFSEAYGVRI